MVPICTPLGLHPCVYVMSLETDHVEPRVFSQLMMSVPAIWKSAERIGETQRPTNRQNKSASSAEFGR